MEYGVQQRITGSPLAAAPVSQFYFLTIGFTVKTIYLLLHYPHCSTTFLDGLHLTARTRTKLGALYVLALLIQTI
jgi:hypothetical protein